MKKVWDFVKSNIAGVLTAIALSVIVWLFTGMNVWLLLLGFVAGYFIVGIFVEYIILFFRDGSTRKPKNRRTVKPDKRAAIELASAGEVDFITDADLIQKTGEDTGTRNAEDT